MADREIVGSFDHLLVVGVDGSGKSTFLTGLESELGYTVLEPTSSPRSKEFKKSTTNTLVDVDFVDKREDLYLDLNKGFETSMQIYANNTPVATTGNSLVTLLSHTVMREIVAGTGRTDFPSGVARDWLGTSHDLKPSSITLIHAPDDVIHSRITQRLSDGDSTEVFWGFNSPFFLSKYQQSWMDALVTIASNSDITCMSIDSSQHSPVEMIDMYEATMAGTYNA